MPLPTDLCVAATVASDLAVPVDLSVERCVSAASRTIARLCGRAFERATVTEYPASYGRAFLLLERPPLVAIDVTTDQVRSHFHRNHRGPEIHPLTDEKVIHFSPRTR
jgi:hypothetical protein